MRVSLRTIVPPVSEALDIARHSSSKIDRLNFLVVRSVAIFSWDLTGVVASGRGSVALGLRFLLFGWRHQMDVICSSNTFANDERFCFLSGGNVLFN